MEKIESLFDIIETLRGDNGCEWDKKQTPVTMMACLEEEVYELQEAIAENDRVNICEEIGDVLFQLIFIISIFQEKNDFSFSDVIDQVAQKMIRRHPHVYGEKKISSHKELLHQWELIKKTEKLQKNEKVISSLDNVPKGMPSLIRAFKVSKCAVKVGFEWESIQDVLKTVRSEIDEFEAALDSENPQDIMMEFGDILFSLVNVARKAKFHPETALSFSTAKFEGRFRAMEKLLNQRNVKLNSLSQEEKDKFWDQAKISYDR